MYETSIEELQIANIKFSLWYFYFSIDSARLKNLFDKYQSAHNVFQKALLAQPSTFLSSVLNCA